MSGVGGVADVFWHLSRIKAEYKEAVISSGAAGNLDAPNCCANVYTAHSTSSKLGGGGCDIIVVSTSKENII